MDNKDKKLPDKDINTECDLFLDNVDLRPNARWKVYVYTNNINGKKYVGQTCNTLKCRSGKNGKLYLKCPYFGRAIAKYGWDNFTPEIIAENLTREEANKLEKSLISLLNTTNQKYGYNISKGGSDETHTSLDLTGQIFGRWKVLYLAETPKGCVGRYWMCECQCDKKTKRLVRQDHLRSGMSKSCGCIASEINSQIIPNEFSIADDIVTVYMNDGKYSFIIDVDTYEKIKDKHWYYDKSNNRIVGSYNVNLYALIFGLEQIRRKLYMNIIHKNSNRFDFRRDNMYISPIGNLSIDEMLLYMSQRCSGIKYAGSNGNKKWIVAKNVFGDKQHSFYTLQDALSYKETRKEVDVA